MNGIPGGYYIGADGKPHDANGNPIPVIDAPKETPLPEGFPSYQSLIDAGLTTVEAVRNISDETMLTLKGVGAATLAKIREATNG